VPIFTRGNRQLPGRPALHGQIGARRRLSLGAAFVATGAALLAAGAVTAVTSSVAGATPTNPTQTGVVAVPVVTNPSSPSIPVGQSVTDHATVTVTTANQSEVDGGSVQFTTCGPLTGEPPTGACGTGTGASDLGGPVNLTAPSTAGVEVATSTSFSPTQPGLYCFGTQIIQAPGAVTAIRRAYTSTNTTTTAVDDECFTVTSGVPTPHPTTQLTTATVVTAPSAPSITLGSSDTDTATVSTSGAVPTGSVSFTVCGPTSLASSCTTGAGDATALGSVSLSPAPSAGADAAAATSPVFTPPSTGTYCFVADYSGDSTVAAASDGSPPSECFTVTAAARVTPGFTTTLLTGSSLSLGAAARDSATVSGGHGTPTGAVTFTICQETTGTTPCGGGTTVATVASATTTTATTATTATYDLPAGDAARPSSAGTWCFSASYDGNRTYAPMAVETDPKAECFAVVAPSVAATSGKAPVVATTLPVTAASGGAIAGATTVHTGMWWAGSTPWVAGTVTGGLVLLGLGRHRRSQRRLALARHRVRSH